MTMRTPTRTFGKSKTDRPRLRRLAPSPSPVSLESILCTEEVERRPSRPPQHEIENRALQVLIRALAESPGTVLQKLAETILRACDAHSAGVSLVTGDEKWFYWPAVAGVWKPHIGGGTPRDFGPCGDVLDRNAPLAFKNFERRYTYFLPVTRSIEEALLVPFHLKRKPVGTIWAVHHDGLPTQRPFDSADMRLLKNLGAFASAAYQAAGCAELYRAARPRITSGPSIP